MVADNEYVCQNYEAGTCEGDPGGFTRSFVHVTVVHPSAPAKAKSFKCSCSMYASNEGLSMLAESGEVISCHAPLFFLSRHHPGTHSYLLVFTV
jgi:hypothetical protein